MDKEDSKRDRSLPAADFPSLPENKNVPENNVICDFQCLFPAGSSGSENSFRPPRAAENRWGKEWESFFEGRGTLQTKGSRAVQEPSPRHRAARWWALRETQGLAYHVLLELKPPLSALLVFLNAAVQVCKFGGSFLRNRSTHRGKWYRGKWRGT